MRKLSREEMEQQLQEYEQKKARRERRQQVLEARDRKEQRELLLSALPKGLILWGGIGLCRALIGVFSSETYTAYTAIPALEFAICIIAGITMIKRSNWGRLLFLCYLSIAIVRTLILCVQSRDDPVVAIRLIMYITVYASFIVVFTRPHISTFFERQDSEE
jgi:hypothetical protein